MDNIQVIGIGLAADEVDDTAPVFDADWITATGVDAVSGMASFEVDDVSLTTVAAAGSLVAEPLETAIENARTWPEARETLAKVQSHVIVGGTQRVSGHTDVLTTSLAVSRLVSAYATSRDGLAIYWPNSGALTPARLFADALNDSDELSIGLVGTWVRLQWFQAPGANGGPAQLAVSTQGLADFIGYEIDFEPTGFDAQKIAEHVLYTARYLIQSGPAFNTGDTIGEDETGKLRVTVLTSGYRAVPAYSLSLLSPS